MIENMQTYQTPAPDANQPSPAELAEKMLYAEMERKRPQFRLSFAAPGFDIHVEAAQVGNLAPFLNIIAKSVLGPTPAEPELAAEQEETKPATPAPAAPAPEKPKRTRNRTEQAPEIPPPPAAPQKQYEPEPEPEAPAAPAPIAAPPAAPAPVLDRTEVANLFLEYSTKVGMDNAKKLLAAFNAPKFRDILDAQLPEFVARLKAAMEVVG